MSRYDRLCSLEQENSKRKKTLRLENLSPPPQHWTDEGTYWLNIHEQGTDGWHSARRDGWGVTKLLTASNFAKAAGHEKYFTTREAYMEEFVSGVKPKFTEEAIRHMARGTENEPIARMLYEDARGVTVREVGLAVPKFDIRIGSSVDGMVGKNGLIEIKCPEKVYWKLRGEDDTDQRDKVSCKKQRDKIFPSHYDQMQGGMAITGRKWCDYVVFGVKSEEIHIERVHWDQDYWDNDLYPGICSFLEKSGCPPVL